MQSNFGNVFTNCPDAKQAEQFEDIINLPNTRIERIVSHGQVTPVDQPYEQDEHEWVIVLQGEAEVTLLAPTQVHKLKVGDYLFIAAGRKHLVTCTIMSELTIWLAVFSKP